MRTVQLGEIIKGVRNTTTFGMVLCVASMIMIIKLQASWLTREYVDDLVTYLGLVEGTKKSEDCLRSKEDFICNVDLENPWVMEFILLEAVRKDFGEFISTEERTWMAEKEGGIVLSKNGSAPQSLWRLRLDLDIPSQELDIKESFRSYRIIVGIDGTIEVVRCTGGHIAFLTPSWHLDCERLPEKLEKTNRWLASIGQSHPAGLQNLSLFDPIIGKLVNDYYVAENTRETVAGLAIPLTYAPFILSALLFMCSVLLGGFAGAFNLARRQADLLKEEYGWPLLYPSGGVIGYVTFYSGLALAFVVASAPMIAACQAWTVIRTAPFGQHGLWALIASLLLFCAVISLNVITQILLRKAILNHQAAEAELRIF